MIDLILYDPVWRYRFHRLIRGAISLFIAVLVLFSFNRVLRENATLNGRYNEYITIDGEAKYADMVNLQKQLDQLPQWVLDTYINEGGIIIVSSYKKAYTENGVAVEQDSQEVVGTFSKNAPGLAIWLYNSENNIEKATLHEFGHFVDYHFNTVSETDQFLICFENEKAVFLNLDGNTYHISSESEYFAACFKWYLVNPGALKKACPQTYEFFNGLMKNGEIPQ